MPTESGGEQVQSSKTAFDLEKIARVLSLVAIPAVIAAFGWVIQDQLSKRTLSHEYVKLAVSILEKPDSSAIPPGLRNWAVELLNQNSPTKFSPETLQKLKTGEINLAGVLGNLLATANGGGGMAVAPDGQTVAIGQDDGRVTIWELQFGRLLRTLAGHTSPVTAVAYTPDAREILSASLDGTVAGWDLQTGQKLRELRGRSPIIGFAVSPDGRSLLTRSVDGEIQMWDLATGRLLSQVRLEMSKP